jgi:hypothetical protein
MNTKSTSVELTQGTVHVLKHVSLTHELLVHLYKVHSDVCGQVQKVVLA